MTEEAKRIGAIIGAPPEAVRQALSRHGVLRAGINLSNFLLVSSRTADGGPAGVSPDMAAILAECLGLPLQYVTYPSPGPLADAAERDEWDVALVGAEPQRAAVIDFTPAYTEIEATYLVPAGSPLQSVAEVDRKGRRIAVAARTAYGLWLERNIREAELITGEGFDGAYQHFVDQKLDALAGLRPKLIEDEKTLPGSRMLPGRFMAVQQALGTPKASGIALDYLRSFVMAAIESGVVRRLIAKHGVTGLSVAEPPPGS
ncbi:amino acid ABC transporter substrate-binding protein (PAAT family) [Bosea sp. AK1]|uniref:transporter substrate-binding domain-containing protein n=1 Tax=Bosea sp. AK1 TaxID=2587160 RepID=UPI001150474F|nr:transporter substrate-binding domain-containing protein [Bosea sp. AK1]TQI74267.1 amino acid ABC transporter substrate-binding protein (PAAT family) [Bosea sp. AK1]